MPFSVGQKRLIFERGFLTLPGIVPRKRIDAALLEINRHMGTDVPGESPACYSNQFWLGIKSKPAILDLLYETPLIGLAESLMGRGKVLPIEEGHIVLRFPRAEAPSAGGEGEGGFHIDGIRTSGRDETAARAKGSLPKSELGGIDPYALQICVLLSDLPRPDSGNLAVYPSSHLLLPRFIRDSGLDAFRRGLFRIPKRVPEQTLGKAGDAVLCHYLTVHDGMPNLSPDIRYAVFFRLRRAEHLERPEETLADPWLGWPGMAKLLGSHSRL